MPLQATSGAASYDAFGGGVPVVPNYIEDVFSCFLYTGNGSTQTINNGIDLAGKGGLVWTKARSSTAFHKWYDSARGIQFAIESNTTDANQTEPTGITSFNSNGYTYGTDGNTNSSGTNYVSWTFRKQQKFFDVVTYTGNGSTRTVPHNLGSAPGFIIVKRVTSDGGWWAYHRSLGATKYMSFNTTAAVETASGVWNDTDPTATVFTVGSFSEVNQNGETFVAYLFAHNAGGFGLTGTDNVISCGSYVGNGDANGPVVNLGFEPQWLLIKSTGVKDWIIYDTMRGLTVSDNNDEQLFANTADPTQFANRISPTATGFKVVSANADSNSSGVPYIYIAIRRGPMRVPTTGTSVFAPATWTGNNTAGRNIPTGFPVDLTIEQIRTTSSIQANLWFDRLRGYSSTITGASAFLRSQVTDAESSLPDYNYVPTMDGFNFGSTASLTTQLNNSGVTAVAWNFRRAPGFFDEVCYTASGSVPLAHNLGVTPELVIYKTRGSADSWWTCVNVNGVGRINNTGAWALTGLGNGLTAVAQATSTTISNLNGVLLSPGNTVVAYLFASCPGVSKVGSYTGTGTTQVINCGFTAGSRFIMIKRTDSTGSWYVWDSSRGIVAGNDPYLLLNSTAAEVTNTDFVDTASVGFEISSTAPAEINASGGTFIFLAVA